MMPKPKRGKEYILIPTGETVYLERVVDNEYYFVCWGPGFTLDDNFDRVKITDLQEVYKKGSSIQAKAPTKEATAHKNELNDFFNNQALKIPHNCMNCGRPLYCTTQMAKRCVTAHILPKATFKSIETNPSNIFFLGAQIIGSCDCHDQWDNKGSDHRVKMKVYDLAVNRYKKILKPCLTDHEQIKANKYLNIET